ncbi:unnamed protein product [Cuscuta campestris]|uniref:Secreted protein n=1 Tax=Cuscuta campestris TaxID=132261 RepID=A0A484LIS9_9ASTE|nr:unnamed protein product [Cuscuta campestris]
MGAWSLVLVLNFFLFSFLFNGTLIESSHVCTCGVFIAEFFSSPIMHLFIGKYPKRILLRIRITLETPKLTMELSSYMTLGRSSQPQLLKFSRKNVVSTGHNDFLDTNR